MNNSYSRICNHSRINRLNENFVRCMDCGQSMISQKKLVANKTRKDFTNENKSFVRNFDRNFTNVLEETDQQSSMPLLEYWMDRNWANLVIIDRSVQFQSHPPKYKVIVNGEQNYLTDDHIRKLLADINAIKVDESQVKNRQR